MFSLPFISYSLGSFIARHYVPRFIYYRYSSFIVIFILFIFISTYRFYYPLYLIIFTVHRSFHSLFSYYYSLFARPNYRSSLIYHSLVSYYYRSPFFCLSLSLPSLRSSLISFALLLPYPLSFASRSLYLTFFSTYIKE